MTHDALTIGQVARQVGLRTSAVRYYESVGLLPQPRRVSGQRRYDESSVQMLRIIQLAQEAGFSIAEIRTLFAGFAAAPPPQDDWRPLVERKLQEVDTVILRAQQMRIMLHNLARCDSVRFADCLLPQADQLRSPSGAPECVGC